MIYDQPGYGARTWKIEFLDIFEVITTQAQQKNI